MLRFLGGCFLDLSLWIAHFAVVMANLMDFLDLPPLAAMCLSLDWHFGV